MLPTRLMRAAVVVLPAAGASIVAHSRCLHPLPLGASDDTAALAERLEFTVGHGPSESAHEQGHLFLIDAEQLQQRWPTFAAELLLRTPYRSMLSVPIQLPDLGGVVEWQLYYRQSDPLLGAARLHDIHEVAAAIVDLLLAGSGPQDGPLPGPVWMNNRSVTARSLVWIAIGMVEVALGATSLDALSMLRAHAQGHHSTVDEIASALVFRELPVDTLTG